MTACSSPAGEIPHLFRHIHGRRFLVLALIGIGIGCRGRLRRAQCRQGQQKKGGPDRQLFSHLSAPYSFMPEVDMVSKTCDWESRNIREGTTSMMTAAAAPTPARAMPPASIWDRA